jgi:hypothetical protein
MRKILLTILLTIIVFGAPWRLMVLVGEAFAITPSHSVLSPNNDEYWREQALEMRLRSMGWQVFYETDMNYMGQPVYGLTDSSEHIIRIEKSLSWNARFAVLAHEAGHTVQPWWLDRMEGDVFAESVATLITGNIREHARWLSVAKFETLFTILTEWPRIYTAADLFLER